MNKETKITIFFILLLLMLMGTSCSTDVDVNGENRDIPIVYCVLDQSADCQYVKVNKCFLGPEPASIMAQRSDSLFYNDVTVSIKDSLRGKVYHFVKTDSIPKDDGYFASNRNDIWMSKMGDMSTETIYVLDVDINNGQHKVNATTKLIDGADFVKPRKATHQIGLTDYDGTYDYVYKNGKNGRIFQVSMTFYYLEVRGNDTVEKHLTLTQSKDYRVTESPDAEVKGSIGILSFYNALQTSIPPADGTVQRFARYPASIDLVLSVADENYATYMEITAPSQGIVQEKPSYTNLSDGYGLFASRLNIRRQLHVDTRTLDSLNCGIYTKDLGFVNRLDHPNYYK